MLRISALAAFACLGFGVSALSASEPQPGELVRYPTFGVAFQEPKGWAEQIRDKGKTIARWIKPDSVTKRPIAMIVVEGGRTPARSLDDVARGLAKNFHGTVADRPTTLGGTRALRIVAHSDGEALRPVEGLATIHDGLLYLVMGGVTAGHSVADELEAIRTSWTWIPIEPPYKHLEFRQEPLSLFDGTATMNVPALMHTYPTKHPDGVLDLGLHNIVRNEPDFLAYVQLMPVAAGRTVDELKKGLAQGLQTKYKVKGPIEWRPSGNNALGVVSDGIEIETPDEASGRKRMVLIRWALVKIDERRLILVNFTLPPEAPQGAMSTSPWWIGSWTPSSPAP